MTLTLHLALIIIALVCFLAGALSALFVWRMSARFNYLAWGLFCWLLAISSATG
jgi:hypothetical protein